MLNPLAGTVIRVAHDRAAFTVYGVGEDGVVRLDADGWRVWCGHRHRAVEGAEECLTRLRAAGGGAYRVFEVVLVGQGPVCRK